MTPNDLLARVREAKEPSIWVDLEILKLADPDHIAVQFWSDEYRTELRSGKLTNGFSAWKDTSSHSAPFPAYTSSIDAIVALIEQKLPGWWWLREDGQSVRLVGPDNGDFYPSAVGRHHLVPLALCCAFLSAIASNGDGE